MLYAIRELPRDLPLVAWSYLEPDSIPVVIAWGMRGEELASVEACARAVIARMTEVPAETRKKLCDRLIVASAMDLIHALNRKYRQDNRPVVLQMRLQDMALPEPSAPDTSALCATCKDKTIQEPAVYICALCQTPLCRRHAHHITKRVFCWSCYITTMMYGKKE
ncbi:MAG: hypothetical protein IMW89_06400 [Ktedonobacteraceae bacterium]|nr:hypothetical protein [Ktedonobacteraceae bacterium]